MKSSELLELGFEKAGNKLKGKEDLKRKLMIAFEFHRVVTPGIIDRFQKQLRKKTEKKDKHGNVSYDTLAFCKIGEYGEIPPADVLDKVKEAKARNCFDYFEVAKVETVEVRPDPIIFGRIKDVDDRFFVAQWDNDVRIEEILSENEG